MTAKKISELTAKTPVSTDVIPVADPVTGIAGKSTVAQILGIDTSSALSITASGGDLLDVGYYLQPPYPIFVNSSLFYFSGKFAWGLSPFMSPLSTATSIIFNDLAGFVGSINIPQSLTSISFPALKFVVSINFQTATNSGTGTQFTSVSFPELEVVQSAISYTGNLGITTYNFPKLKFLGNISFSGLLYATSFNYPMLKSINGNITYSNNPAMTSFSMPLLEYLGANIYLNNLTLVSSVDLPSLKYMSGGIFQIAGTTGISNINLPSLVAIQGVLGQNAIDITGTHSSLTSFVIGSTLKKMGGNVVITAGSLNQTSVDGILVRLAALDGTNSTTSYDNRSVTITGSSSPPSATGLAAKATLVSRGCTVTHN